MISEFEDIAIETISKETHREIKLKKKLRESVNCGTIASYPMYKLLKFSKESWNGT